MLHTNYKSTGRTDINNHEIRVRLNVHILYFGVRICYVYTFVHGTGTNARNSHWNGINARKLV
jgi:hypothetical protein